MQIPIKKFLFHRKTWQIGSLYFSMVLTIVVSFIISIINTRTLGPERFGDYKFIINLFQFMAILSSFGMSTTASQLIAQMDSTDNRKFSIIGANFIITSSFAALFVIISIIFSFVEPYIFHDKLGLTILFFSPLVAVFILNSMFENILQGDNKIHQLSLFRVLPGILFMLGLIAVNFLFHVDLYITLSIQLSVGIIVIIFFYKEIQPMYNDYHKHIKFIWESNKKYGLQVYFGSLSNVATIYISTFAISYFLDNTNVGYFALASNLTMPLMQVASVVGTTYFKDFAHLNKLPNKVTVSTILITFFSTLIFIFLIKPLVVLVYTERFIAVASLSVIIAVGSAMQGLGDYFNRFLGAHGRGKELRNGAIAAGIMNVAGYIFLVKYFGIVGAASTKLFTGIIYCSMMIFYYVRFRRMITIDYENK